ncbi:MAG: hypothetical protein AB1777_04005 [Bacteroidota bacterium]
MHKFYSKIVLVTFLGFSLNLSNAQNLEVKIATPNGKIDFCANQPITLVAQTNVENDDIANRRWEGDMSIVEKDLGDILIIRPKGSGVYTFSIYLKDIYGNEASGSVTVNVKPIFKPILKVKNNRLEIEFNARGASFSYYFGNRLVNEDEFKNAKQPGKYYVIATTPEGCSTSSSVVEIP